MKMEKILKELERALGYRFQNLSLLQQAITHSSYSNEKNLGKLGCNERLEFVKKTWLELFKI